MGSAASRCPDWDAKPCEAINDVDGGTPCDVPRDELEKAKARYDALKREHRKDQAALATAGDALLEELGLAVAYRFPVSKVQRQRPQERVKRPPTNQPDAKKVLREFE